MPSHDSQIHQSWLADTQVILGPAICSDRRKFACSSEMIIYATLASSYYLPAKAEPQYCSTYFYDCFPLGCVRSDVAFSRCGGIILYEIHRRSQPCSECILRRVCLFCETNLPHRRWQPCPEASPRHIDVFSELHAARTFLKELRTGSLVIFDFFLYLCKDVQSNVQ